MSNIDRFGPGDTVRVTASGRVGRVVDLVRNFEYKVALRPFGAEGIYFEHELEEAK